MVRQAGSALPPPYALPAGELAWFLGLIAFVPFPVVSAVCACVIMISVGLGQRRQPEPTRTNGIRAANWGLTYLLATMILMGAHFSFLFTIKRFSGFSPWGIPILACVFVSAFHIIYSIVAGICASSGRQVGFSGIPFLGPR